MKVFKPQKLGLLTRTFQRQDEVFFVVSPLVFFAFGSSPGLRPEAEMWKTLAPELGEQPLDVAMPKVRGEWLVCGRAYPAQPPKATAVVHAQVGGASKTLYAIGDRVWNRGVPSDPVFFHEMPLTYGRAFGGGDYPKNPLGKGFAATDGVWSLPNVEDPGRLVRSQRDRPDPAGFLPYDLMWPQRREQLGTYDASWLKELSPGYPRDMQWSAFNAAPKDQQLEGFFQGDEALAFDGMHPTRARVEGRLPGVAPRVLLVRKGHDDPTEVQVRPDTVWILPHLEVGVLIFRGLARIGEDDAADVATILAGLESMSAPRPLAHYVEALRKRGDRKQAAILSLSDADLLPEGEAAKPPPDDGLRSQGLLRKRLRKRMEREYAALGAKLAAQKGIDPSKVQLPPLPPEPPEPSSDPAQLIVQMDEMQAFTNRAKAEADAARAALEAKVREQLASRGIDYDAKLREAAASSSRRPTMATEVLANVARKSLAAKLSSPELDAALADPKLAARAARADEQLSAAYKKVAHHLPAPPKAPPTEEQAKKSAEARAAVSEARASGGSLADKDLSGVDLSGIDLTGADLRGAMLEGANLSGAQLGGANLSGALLAHADLTKANLFAAKLVDANLGGAKLVEAEVGEADLTRATLAKADLSGARMRNACLSGANLAECKLAGADWSGVSAPGATFAKIDMTGMKLVRADLTKAVFLECIADDVDATQANLAKATFLQLRAQRIVLREATLDGAAFVSSCALPHADMQRASLERTNLRGAHLPRANLSHARLPAADFSQCELQEAILYRAFAREARFVRADLSRARMSVIDLLGGSLAKANLAGTDLRGANLFRADLTGVRLDTETRVTGANLVRARMPRGQPKAGT